MNGNVKRKITKWSELFFVKPPLMSIRNEMKDSPVPATKDDSSVFFIGESFLFLPISAAFLVSIFF